MKKFLMIFAALAAVTAFAVAESNLIDVMRGPKPLWIQPKLYLGAAVDNPPSDTQNGISGTFAKTTSLDVGVTDAGTCVQSAAITLTGANVGDVCILGLPIGGEATLLDGGGGASEGRGAFSCFVSAADAVKIQFCSHAPLGTELNPDPRSFNIRVFGN